MYNINVVFISLKLYPVAPKELFSAHPINGFNKKRLCQFQCFVAFF